MSDLPSSRAILRAGVVLLAGGLLAGAQCTPVPSPIQPPPESVVLAYAGGGLDPALVVRSSTDGDTWSDWHSMDRLSGAESQPRGVGMAADARGIGHVLSWGLGLAGTRSRYALAVASDSAPVGVAWDSQPRNDTLDDAPEASAPSLAPYGDSGDAFLVAFGVPVGPVRNRPRLLLQPTAVPDTAAPAPRTEVALPLPAGAEVSGRPKVFARGSSNILFAYRPHPSTPGMIVVHDGVPNAAQRSVAWVQAPWIGRVNEGDFLLHEIQDFCLGGDGGDHFVLGVLLTGTATSGPNSGQVTRLVRLYRSDNGGRGFARVQLNLASASGALFPFEHFLADPVTQLGCAFMPGATEVLLATIAAVPGQGVVMDGTRVKADGTMVSVDQGDESTRMFPRPPMVLPFALLTTGRVPAP